MQSSGGPCGTSGAKRIEGNIDLGVHGGLLDGPAGGDASGGGSRVAGLAVIVTAVWVRLLLREFLRQLCLAALAALLPHTTHKHLKPETLPEKTVNIASSPHAFFILVLSTPFTPDTCPKICSA